jgi:hypothetical protein
MTLPATWPLLIGLLFPCMPFLLHFYAAPTLAAEEKNSPIDFDRQIRPILSDHCFKCHGPDAGQLQAGLRMDRKTSVFSPADSGATPVVANMPESSEMIRRISETDPGAIMPPPEEGKPLTAEQISLLTRWVASGAAWTNHWSFEPIREPPIPTASSVVGRVHNPIDAFVLAKLQSVGLPQAPAESKQRLIRRVSLDLTGLPPTLQQVADFVNDDSPLAFEKVVDRLLSSEHFGERLALPWLDLARYGDTSGYHNDSLRDMWLWREWVVNAFNANMPFDQFTIEQLAGDLLPDASLQQQVATGFHRNVMTSDEGGLIDAEYRNLYVVDRVATTGVTWLGMTVACAQCHDHKYDPITQADFYQLYAFFNNVPENGKDGVRDRNPKPFLRVPSPDQQMRLKQYERELGEAQDKLKEMEQGLAAKQRRWEAEFVSREAATQLPRPDAYFPLDQDGDGLASNESESPSESQVIRGETHGKAEFTEGAEGQSFTTTGEQWFDYGDRFDFEKDQAFSVATYLYVLPGGGAPFGKMDDSNGARGWDVEFHGLRPSVHLIHRWSEDAIHIQADDELPAETWTHLAITYDGSGKAAGLKLYINGLLSKTSVKKDGLQGSIQTTVPFSIGRRGSASVPFHGRIDDLRIYQRDLAPAEIAAVSIEQARKLAATDAEQRTETEKQQLEKYFRQTQMPELAELQSSVDALRKEKQEFENALPNTMVMSEMEKPRETFIKVRGNYDQDGTPVQAAFPEFLSEVSVTSNSETPTSKTLTSDNSRSLNRLDLARWLIDPKHPLTARVTINRWWAMLFGTGLVKTLNDFGSQGERPSHPELLDWLAADLLRDWDTKRAIKQIVMSATYQQAAHAAPELLARDQENRLLARGPRQRLDAEVLRDNALAIAGILNPAIGGKSIKPSQPAGTWEINEMSGYKYEKSTGEDLYRRGLYVYWRRSTVYPSFVTLDAPTREFCVAQRANTSTPLQSLVLMNDPVFVEAARAMAQRVLTAGDMDASARLTYAWQLALARQPSPAELSILQRTLDQQLAHYRQDSEAAQKLSTVGDYPLIESLPPTELSAWTAVCNVILNLNETISN